MNVTDKTTAGGTSTGAGQTGGGPSEVLNFLNAKPHSLRYDFKRYTKAPWGCTGG